MEKRELLNLLKENLKVNVYHPQVLSGDHFCCLDSDTDNVVVEVYFGDELITSGRSY